MAEKVEMHNDSIKKVIRLCLDKNLDELIESYSDFDKNIKSLKTVINNKLKDIANNANNTVEESTTQVEEKQDSVGQTTNVQNSDEKVEAKDEPVSGEKPIVVTGEVEKNPDLENNEKTDEKSNVSPAPVEKQRPSFIVRREYVVRDNASTDKKPRNEHKNYSDRNNQDRNFSDRNYGQRTFDSKSRSFNDKNGERKSFTGGQKPSFNKKNNSTYVAPPVIINNQDKRSFGKKNKTVEKSFEDKFVKNKRSLIKNNVDIDDFDEDKTGYRKFRPIKKAKEEKVNNAIKIEKAVITTEMIPLKVLSEKIGITATEITKMLFKEGIMKTINDSIDFDVAAYIADEIGVVLEQKLDKTAEDVFSAGYDEVVDDLDKLIVRPPVVTVMGHVDHGKTSILDKIRKSNVTAGEAGGITQHIGAYQVTVDGKTITFLDTPGHAAFTAMRARGAQATDIAVLVVAADDGIMPQTIEAINHAKAANVPIIVAVNKIDKPEADIERVKTGLANNGVLPEEWGGDTIVCPLSAKTGEGIRELLSSINLVAEMAELKANPSRKAKGVVIEAKLDQSKGAIATILVQNGTLKVSDNVIVGTVTGKIRAMTDDKGRRITSAGPSTPVSIMGLDDVPSAGDILFADDQDKLIKMVAEERKNKERESMVKSSSTVTLDDVFNKINEGRIKGINIIVKADVQGSVEAVKSSLEKLSNEEVKINVIHAQVGAIKESDIMLAESSKAIIIGFNVRPDSNAKQVAERSGVDIKLYRIIYEAIEDVEKALKGMLAPKFSDVYLGKAEVREVFKISGVGQVAGCYVADGKIIRSGKLRIYRDDIMITEGNVLQLKRFKDDVKEVSAGFECGISIEKFNDIKIGDYIECYQVEENKE